MRGRSLNDSFIILDEAQNTSVEQMKMFLTRLGFGSKAVVTGDITQVDLPRQQRSGLRHAIDVLRGVEGVAFTFFNSRDVVRHPLVQRIVRRTSATPRPRTRGTRDGQVRHARRGCPLRSRSNCSLRHAGRGLRGRSRCAAGPGRHCRGGPPSRIRRPAPKSARTARRAARAGYTVCIRVVGKAESHRLDLQLPRQGQADQRAFVSGVRRGAGRVRGAGRPRDLRPGGVPRGPGTGQTARGALGAHGRARHAAPAGLRPRAGAGRPAHGDASKWKSCAVWGFMTLISGSRKALYE